MDKAPERFGFPDKKLVHMNRSKGMILQLDSSMFTDLGNELMKKCYDRWVSCAPIYTTGNCKHQFDSFTGTPSDIRFTEFETEFKKICGYPSFSYPEPNLKDAYGYSVGEITKKEPRPFTAIEDEIFKFKN